MLKRYSMQFYKDFYLVISLDFKGRLNVIGDFLNYQEDKLARALIIFNEKSKINLDWFKVYMVQLYGLSDYKSFVDMIVFFDKFLVKKIESFRETNFWLEAEEKWLFLACCLEWERYTEIGTLYETGLPIYFDATYSATKIVCSYLYLVDYARDLNLLKSTKFDKLGDFYIIVINKYKEYLKQNNKSFFEHITLILKTDLVWRKLFKNIVMTLFYGLTRSGINKKLMSKIDELGLQDMNGDDIKILGLTFYNFIQTIPLFGELFLIDSLVKEIRSTIKLKSKLSSFTNEDDPFFELNIFYSNIYKKSIAFDRIIKGLRVYKKTSFIFHELGVLDDKKQFVSFKANLTHHLDALIVFNVIDRCVKANINLSVIFDCFGVLMKDIDQLNVIVRESYKSLLLDNKESVKNFLNQVNTESRLPMRDVVAKNILKDIEEKQQREPNIFNIEESLYLICILSKKNLEKIYLIIKNCYFFNFYI